MTVTTFFYSTTFEHGLEIAEATDFDDFELDFAEAEQVLEADFCPCEEF